MKNLKIFFLAAVAIVAGVFTACNDDDFKAGPSVDGAQVYFPENTTTLYSISDDVTSISIPVKRIAKDEALTVPLLVSEESGLFTIPSSVSFAAGKETSELLITFDRTQLEDGKAYPLSLLINDEDNTTPYGNRMLAITVEPWPWVKMGIGLFRDDWFCAMYKGGNPEIEVTMHKHKSKKGIYMVEDMYGWNFLTEFFEAPQDAIEAQIGTYTPTNITIDCSDPSKVTIARQFTGITDKDEDYGDYEIATLKGGEGTLVNGVISFPKEAIALYCKAGGLKANKSGLFRIVLPDATIPAAITVEYSGQFNTPDGVSNAVLAFGPDENTASFQYAVIKGDLTKDDEAMEKAVAGIIDGSITSIRKTEKGEYRWELSAGGTYTAVVVPFDKTGEPGTPAAAKFNFVIGEILKVQTGTYQVEVAVNGDVPYNCDVTVTATSSPFTYLVDGWFDLDGLQMIAELDPAALTLTLDGSSANTEDFGDYNLFGLGLFPNSDQTQIFAITSGDGMLDPCVIELSKEGVPTKIMTDLYLDVFNADMTSWLGTAETIAAGTPFTAGAGPLRAKTSSVNAKKTIQAIESGKMKYSKVSKRF